MRKGDRVPYGYWTTERLVQKAQDWYELYGYLSAPDWNPPMLRKWGSVARLRRWESGLWPHINTVRTRVGSWNELMRLSGLPIRRFGEHREPKFDVDEAVRLYTNDQLGTTEIARRLGISVSSVRYHLDKREITIRSHAQGVRLANARRKTDK